MLQIVALRISCCLQ